jgi:hypothetical protein
MDLQYFSSVEELELRRLKVKNYHHHLPNLREAKFYGCLAMEDLTCFWSLSTLTIHDVSNPLDVSPLKDIPVLDFAECDSIINIGALGNVRELTLDVCEDGLDVSQLGSVYSLALTFCEAIVGLSPHL